MIPRTLWVKRVGQEEEKDRPSGGVFEISSLCGIHVFQYYMTSSKRNRRSVNPRLEKDWIHSAWIRHKKSDRRYDSACPCHSFLPCCVECLGVPCSDASDYQIAHSSIHFKGKGWCVSLVKFLFLFCGPAADGLNT